MYKRSIAMLVLCVLFAFSLTPVMAQNFDKFVLNGNGARAAGMGNAFTAISDDATAISWNPAGLTQLYTMEASVVGRLAFGSLGTDYEFADVSVERSSKFQVNFASFVFPFKAGDYNLVGGVAFRRLYDLTEKQTFKVESDFGDFEAIDDYTGGINAITPAIGFKFNEMLSFGAGINILTGSLEYEGEDIYGSTEDWSNDFSGTSFDLGFLVKPSQQFSLGANLNLPYTMKIAEEDYETEVNVPLFFSLGAAFRATDQLLLAADFRSRNWEEAEINEEGYSYKFKEMGINNANSLHFGLEYLAQSGENFLPLRLGFYTEPTLSHDENEDQIVHNAFTAGIGLIMEKIIFDSSVEFVLGKYTGDTETDEFANEREVEYTYSDIRITVGAAIHLGK